MGLNEKLRADRLIFYEQDIARLESEMDGLLELSGARSALLVDREGHMVSRRGEPIEGRLEAVSDLVAGSFAATREMARLLGEDEFSVLYHQGARDSIHVQLIGDRTLLAILFDERSNLGMVRFYAQETGKMLASIFEDIANRKHHPEASLSDAFSRDATRALDNLF